jgi:hypothetical protein
LTDEEMENALLSANDQGSAETEVDVSKVKSGAEGEIMDEAETGISAGCHDNTLDSAQSTEVDDVSYTEIREELPPTTEGTNGNHIDGAKEEVSEEGTTKAMVAIGAVI